MTDMIAMAKQLLKRIEWQNVPGDVTAFDLTEYIADGIRWLYTMTGRSCEFSESMFVFDDGLYKCFTSDLQLDEREYVLLTAMIDFLRKAQTGVDDLTSYSTDAMSITHGDKPFANIQNMLVDLQTERNRVWHKMDRFHLL